MRNLLSILLVVFVVLSGCYALDCSKVEPGSAIELTTFKDVAHDQACIWTSPIRLRENRNWTGALPWIGASAALIVTDRDVMRDNLPTNPTRIRDARHYSNYGLFAVGGVMGGMYVVGALSHNQHMRETSWLMGEAAADAMAVDLATKAITGRNRPNATSRPFEWWRNGAAFPSAHATAAWASATVLAHEYPGWKTKLLAYGGATAISAARVLAYEHSPSDAFVGASLGFLVGRYVYFSRNPEDRSSDDEMGLSALKLRRSTPTFVPIDSDIYAMFDRLIAAGVVESAMLHVRPWTTTECVRLIDEAQENLNDTNDPQLQALVDAISARLPQADVTTPVVETVYTRFYGISGTPLRDSFNFGRTIVNDFGRPYWTGANAFVGASGSVAMGRITFHARGEYQHATGGPIYSPETIAAIQDRQRTTSVLLPSSGELNRFRMIEAYAAMPVKNIEFSFGKQSLWWGPSASGPLLMSNNAEPFYMLRISQISPIQLPWIFRYLGPIAFDSYFGKLTGHPFVPHPYTHGQKLTFKPTPNLELGFSRTVIFAGAGHPLTAHSFFKSFFSVGDNPSTAPGSRNDVGDRHSEFDLSYRVPGLRKYLMFTLDSFADDEPSPLANYKRSAYLPGIYVQQMPWLKKVDLRVEAPITQTPHKEPLSQPWQYFYWNLGYRNGYTNAGELLGSWIGRDGKGVVANSNVWFNAERVLSLGYRHVSIDPKLWTGGGNYTDGSATYRTPIRAGFALQAGVQVERWNIPVLASKSQMNSTVSFEIVWRSPIAKPAAQ